MCAFGYDNKNGDYKLVFGVSFGETSTGVESYTLGTDSWKSVPIIPYFFYYRTFGLLVNGSFHWLAGSKRGTLIVSLDISDERFKEIELPIECLKKRSRFITEAMLDGCLSVLVRNDRVWVMQDYGIRESWIKRYSITNEMITKHPYSLRYIRFFKNGEVLFMNLGKLVLYDPKDGSVVERDMSRSVMALHMNRIILKA